MNLKDMMVMGDDGAEIGELQNITCDLNTGRLEELIVDPTEKGKRLYKQDKDGYLRISSNKLTSVKDYIVVKQ